VWWVGSRAALGRVVEESLWRRAVGAVRRVGMEGRKEGRKDEEQAA